MLSLFRYGPNKIMVRWAVRASWPLIIAAKRLSAVPVFRTVIHPFFAAPWNEVTAVPIGHRIEAPENVILSRRVVERLVERVPQRFILDECICRRQKGCRDYPQDIGCGFCAEQCFVAGVKIVDGGARPGAGRKGCGRCVEACPGGAVSLEIENEETLYANLAARIDAVADIW